MLRERRRRVARAVAVLRRAFRGVDDAVLRRMRGDFDSNRFRRRRRVSAVSRGDRPRRPRGSVRVGAASRVCAVCRRTRATRETCEACALGGRAALRYRCERCGEAQRIPHPMWRYMESPTAISSETWACHGTCGDYTRWRIDSRDRASVPVRDAPASWGSSEEWLTAAREEVERARANEARVEGARPTRVGGWGEGGGDGGAVGGRRRR